MSEILELMTDDGKPTTASTPATQPPAPTPKKRGRPPKPKVDSPPAPVTETGKDVRPQESKEAPKESPPSETPPKVAEPHEPPQPSRVRTTRRSRPTATRKSERGDSESVGNTTLLLVGAGALLAIGLLALLRTRTPNGTPTNAPQGELMDDVTRAWKELESQLVDVSEKLTMRLGQR
ncbi:MAG: hypothetical protein ABSD89_13675 [Halobacteriota archaeon]|jgi:outer membrane biosynthesis protein TonB